MYIGLKEAIIKYKTSRTTLYRLVKKGKLSLFKSDLNEKNIQFLESELKELEKLKKIGG